MTVSRPRRATHSDVPDELVLGAGEADLACRVLNVAVAAIGLLLVAPVMLVVAVLVKVSSPGPVFYTQTRVGWDRRAALGLSRRDVRRQRDMGGRPFKIYKFRTMRTMSTNAREQWAREDDPRITRVGNALRKYRLDELPQLWNVILGDMNIVGPRPEQPVIFGELREQIDRYQVRQRVRPGITGWAQINQDYDSSLDTVKRKVAYDLEYLARRSAVEDLMIMVRTVPVMVLKKGAW